MRTVLKGTVIPLDVANALRSLDAAARELRVEVSRLRRCPLDSAIEAPAVVEKRDLLRAATAAVSAATQAPMSVDQMRLVDRRLDQASDKLIPLSAKLQRTALKRDAGNAEWPTYETNIVSIDGPAKALRVIADARKLPQATEFNGKLLFVNPEEDIELAIARWSRYEARTSLSETVEGVRNVGWGFHRHLLMTGANACLQGDKSCDDLYWRAVQLCLIPESPTSG